MEEVITEEGGLAAADTTADTTEGAGAVDTGALPVATTGALAAPAPELLPAQPAGRAMARLLLATPVPIPARLLPATAGTMPNTTRRPEAGSPTMQHRPEGGAPASVRDDKGSVNGAYHGGRRQAAPSGRLWPSCRTPCTRRSFRRPDTGSCGPIRRWRRARSDASGSPRRKARATGNRGNTASAAPSWPYRTPLGGSTP